MINNINNFQNLLKNKVNELEKIANYKLVSETKTDLTVCSKCLEEGTTNEICHHSWRTPTVKIPYSICNHCNRSTLDLNSEEIKEDYNTFLKYFKYFPSDIKKELTSKLNYLKVLKPLEFTKEEEHILSVYRQGFTDELDEKETVDQNNELLNISYNLGRTHAELGDECRSFDYLNPKQILDLIYKKRIVL